MRAGFLALCIALACGNAKAQDAAAGENVFKRCSACHVVETPDGEILAGARSRTGPNLYGVVGRAAGQAEDFRYSSAMTTAGEVGLVWTPEILVEYLQDPVGFLPEYLDDRRARGRMALRIKADDAADVVAFLQTLMPN